MTGKLESTRDKPPRRSLSALLGWLLAAVVIISLPHQHQLALATAIQSTVLAPPLSLQTVFRDARRMQNQAGALRVERDSLAAQLLERQNVAEENIRLRAMLGLAERGRGRLLPANLYPAGRSGEQVERSFVIDVGSDWGVRSGAPVVAPAGLVGVVRVASPSRAIGDYWTHRDFRASAMTADGDAFGIIRSPGERPLLMRLDGIPFQAELAPGTEIVTSGMGGIFPRGIPIGEVVQLTETEAGWARSYLVKPRVYPDAVREVMVLVGHETDTDVFDLWPGTNPDSIP
ncbi:MAG: rod shape-determining protein MreC [Gemmatimonadales bacterium]